ncbi:SEC-C domain-containing protein [Vibrio tritonius]|uniref:YecA family protein n=1 Tax=Vibrio tritonius TaxID=1435069 RepID=UPI00315C5E0D
MKIGRNTKCWCSSGKKYKNCHLNRDKQTPVSKGEAISHSNKIRNRKCCYVPEQLRHECSKKIINAHTISKSGSLIEIADDTNHVLGLKISLENLIKNNGKLAPERIGVNQASTFKGFCSTHDKSLFACIEDRPFVGDDEQCFALMYRSVAKELYAKEGSLDNAQFIKGADKGLDLLSQISIQDVANGNEIGVETSMKELADFKVQLDEQLLGRKQNNFSHLIIKSLAPIPVAVSAILAPFSDFNGNEIQDLGNLSIVPDVITFNSFSSAGCGYVVFSWIKGRAIINSFIESLLDKGEDKLFSNLVRFFFGSAENTFISPSWWDSLSDKQQEKIKTLIMSGVDPFEFEPEKLLLDDGIDFSGWQFESIEKVNF